MPLRARSVAARAPIREEQPGPGLRTATMRHQLDPHLAPWIAVEHFHMTEERRGGRPVAGHCVVTYLFEDSRGAMIARDDGDARRIAPGGLHWLEACAGTIESIAPEHPGSECHGLRMLVALDPEDRGAAPRVLSVPAEAIPEVEASGTRVRVVAGDGQGARSPLTGHRTAVTILDVRLDPGAELKHVAPSGHRAWALAIAGDGFAGPAEAERRLEHGSAIAFSDDGDAIRLRAGAAGLHAVVAHAGSSDALVSWPLASGRPGSRRARRASSPR
jgi:redox-sensitive bicupin YhaK (pirin superfamily)